jgi:hypothetical protein
VLLILLRKTPTNVTDQLHVTVLYVSLTHTDLRPVSVYVNQAGKIMTVASGLDFVTHAVTNAMDQPTLIVTPVSPTLKMQN